MYFYFKNLTNGENNTKPLIYNFKLSWIKDLTNYEINEQIKIFEHVIKINNWNPKDKIEARGDYDEVVIYFNGYIE